MALSCLGRDELDQGADYGRRLLDESARRQDRVLAAEAHYVLGMAGFWQGRFLASQQHLEAGIAAYDPAQREVHLRLFCQDVLAVSQCRLAVTVAYLGDTERALALSRAAVGRAREIAHPFTLGYVMAWTAMLYCRLGNVDATLEAAHTAVTLSREYEFAFWLGFGRFFEGWALAQRGDGEGIQIMREGSDNFRKTGALFTVSWFAARLASIEAQHGQPQRALACMDAAWRTCIRMGRNGACPS